MDLPKIIAELEAEKQRFDEAIAVLKRLSVRNTRRRGRPPKRFWRGMKLRPNTRAAARVAAAAGGMLLRDRAAPDGGFFLRAGHVLDAPAVLAEN